MSGESAYLNSLLDKYRITDSMKKAVQGKRELIENRLRSEYGSDIVTIMYSGSYGKGTAVSMDYDLDLIVYFRHDTFSSLCEMYESVYWTIKLAGFGPTIRQRVSIGIDLGSFHIDVVPARLIDESRSRDGNLYNFENKTSIKTNIRTHIDFVTGAKCKPMIRIVKLWKKENNLKIKSFAIELITIRALIDYNNEDLYSQFCRVMRYIQNNIDTMRLIDPANTNNNVISNLSIADRRSIRRFAVIATSSDIRSVVK